MKFPGRLACAAVALCATFAFAAEFVRSGGPYVPTPRAVVDAMLELAGVGSSDYVIDLGSGDGRIVLAGATRFKASGMGVDIDGELVDAANASAQRLGVADRVRFQQQDVMETDVSRATVLTLYLLPGMMQNLRPKLLKELRPGTRIVSHDFDFGEWKPDRTVEVTTDEKYDISGFWTSNVHLWTVPASIEGAWRVDWSGAKNDSFLIELKQSYQYFEGRLARDTQAVDVRDGRIEGARIRFNAPGADGRLEMFSGVVNGNHMSGEAKIGSRAAVVRWSATRAP